VDCSALSESVFESDLFGHERGSFTGAYKRKTGLLENAHEGTLFLDEIAHLSLPLQAKMLRFLEQRTIRRVGGRSYLHIDTRVVAATNRDLGMMVEEKTFLPDLYDRLNVLRVRTPDLAEHPEDIPDLIAHFAREENMKQRFGNMAPEVLEVLKAHPWPGNVRQLFNVLRRLAIRTGEGGLQKSEVLEALSY
jgi:transcriptional regulator with PAS, ATPase and Fis domain